MYNPTKPYKKQILNLIKKTWKTPYISIANNGILQKRFSFQEYHHIDGIGTKGIYHWQKRTLKEAVIDSLAMNLNDLALKMATPYALIDHLFVPEDDHKAILKIIKILAKECQKRNIAISGGETAVHNNMKGLEISITLLGFVEKPKENQFKIGDVLIGIASSGIHSNGFTKIREVFKGTFRKDFVMPTNIYLDTILKINKKYNIHGMAHITGGAFTKLKDVLPNNANAVISENHKLEPHDIFKEIYEKNVKDREMYKTFNCGVGYILSVNKKEAAGVLKEIEKDGFKSDIIGEITKGKRKIKIHSKFSKREIIY